MLWSIEMLSWCLVSLSCVCSLFSHSHILLKSVWRLFAETILPENELLTRVQAVPHMMQMKKIALFLFSFALFHDIRVSAWRNPEECVLLMRLLQKPALCQRAAKPVLRNTSSS